MAEGPNDRSESADELRDPSLRDWTTRGFTVSQAQDWRDYYFKATVAKRWRDAGFVPHEAREWIRVGFDPQQAIAWRDDIIDSPFGFDDAAKFKKAGLRPEDVVNQPAPDWEGTITEDDFLA